MQRWSSKYCSNKCQWEFQYRVYIERWRRGEVTGTKGINAKGVSNHLKRFLIIKFGERCAECGWNKRHQKTNKVPLELDHIDGNADNNHEGNIRLLCPNCHSLTDNFRNLNRGRGRLWRKEKYVKVSRSTPA